MYINRSWCIQLVDTSCTVENRLSRGSLCLLVSRRLGPQKGWSAHMVGWWEGSEILYQEECALGNYSSRL